IEENIYVTGEIAGRYGGAYMPEQALAVKTDKGVTVITGCAHPGILKIVEVIKRKFDKENIYFVFGGFHLMSSPARTLETIVKKFREMDVEKAGPTHCTGQKAERIFAKEYKNDFISIKTGQVFEI
ncbi:MAG: MBL fold metallo-hydrolase, partial [Candidatus Omnitrophota bacterium]|nr:MBL fold metallo-hydrolase [Candidatus Omnitrophota bacterium]